MRIAICDDEINILEQVSLCINNYCGQNGKKPLEVVPFSSTQALELAIENGQVFDIYLLDVYIGDNLGTELLKRIRKKGIESPVIFLTTSIEHAPESFESDTLRYLIKPINFEKLYEALDAAVIKANKIGNRFIILKTDNGMENINVSDILYTESHGHYQYVNFSVNNQVRTRMTVVELYNILSKFGGFVRGGSAYIINLKKVKSVSTSELLFTDNNKLLLPRGAHKDIKEAFWNFQYEGLED